MKLNLCAGETQCTACTRIFPDLAGREDCDRAFCPVPSDVRNEGMPTPEERQEMREVRQFLALIP